MVCGRTRVLWGLDNVFELILMQSERIKTGGTGRTFEVPMCNHVQCSLAAFSAEFFGSVLPSARLLKLRCSMLFHYVLHGGRQWQWSSVCAQTVNRPPGVQGSYENHHIWPRLELDEYGTYGTTWGPFQRLPVPGCITLHHVASRCITLHHVASRCITLHHVASRCITLHVASLWGQDTCACAASSRLAWDRQSAGLILCRDRNHSKRLVGQMWSR